MHLPMHHSWSAETWICSDLLNFVEYPWVISPKILGTGATNKHWDATALTIKKWRKDGETLSIFTSPPRKGFTWLSPNADNTTAVQN